MPLNPVKQIILRPLFYAFVLVCIFSAPVAFAADAPSFSVGAFGGYAWSATGEAVDGYQDTEWEGGGAFGGSIMYRRANGLMFELLVEQFELGLAEHGVHFGTLKTTPILVKVEYQGMPKQGKGVAFHATIGGGLVSSDWDESDNVISKPSNDDAFLFELGAGMDYFFTKNIALTLDGRFLGGNIDSEWDTVGGGKEDFTLLVSNFQGLLGLRIWF